MDPGRRAMLSGRRSPSRRDRERDRDIASPRRDPNNRITKPPNPLPSSSRPRQKNNSSYMTQDEQSRQFVADEDKFVLKQAKKKADIRVREGRAKPIDLLAFNMRFIDSDRDVFDDDDADLHVDVASPEEVLQGLDEPQLRQLDSDITSYHTLEQNERNRDYWKALQTICADRRQKLKPQGPDARVVSTVSEDIDRILRPKTYEQLEALEAQIKAKLRSNDDIDVDYWEQLLGSLLVWKAKAKLKKICDAISESKAAMLKLQDPEKVKALGQQQQPKQAESISGPAATVSLSSDQQGRADTKAVSVPSAPQGGAPPPGTARFAQVGNEDFSQATKALYDREVARGISEDEEVFTAEEAVPSGSKPHWADKYRPRKPKYFNRVQMGYEWNKYNQTHYDHDNPPPKVVQGYKFNIFYPELIDKTKAPTFKIIREHGRKKGESFAAAGEEDTCLIRFIAGPPYEDIAFRIVDREWDYSAKRDRGFKSSFDKVRSVVFPGILQLHFQFKKIYYRK
ncbi:mid region of cactin-domain-containing protein [Colletotrichum navitas]|uniref:Splicing factor Cactin n=1 Tax=Colletotrichum navitas TaxID=681940 RepID=A0AAD8PM94_9PEZI|nr:mid region of cactin-domain-containing protein [Colletotrichum navitas]KAK1569847.1 mid region of cactin-domain-containing protein [Colletotrichum navitas]